jgi:hypothetical protein
MVLFSCIFIKESELSKLHHSIYPKFSVSGKRVNFSFNSLTQDEVWRKEEKQYTSNSNLTHNSKKTKISSSVILFTIFHFFYAFRKFCNFSSFFIHNIFSSSLVSLCPLKLIFMLTFFLKKNYYIGKEGEKNLMTFVLLFTFFLW